MSKLNGDHDGLDLSAARVERWRKLRMENRANTPVFSGSRGNKAPGQRRRGR